MSTLGRGRREPFRRILRLPVVLLLALAVALAACASDEPAATDDGTEPAEDATGDATDEATGDAAADEPVQLVAMHTSSPDFIVQVPMAAWDICAERGIEVEQRFAEEASTVIQGMASGDVQIGTNVGVNTGIPAAVAGADIIDVVGTQRPTWALAVTPDIQSFEDLEGKTLAVHGEASFTRAVADWYAENEGFSYEQLIIPGSEVRAEALAQGNIDAAVIDLPDVIQLSQVYPGEFEVLAAIGENFESLIEQDIWFDKSWMEENREVAVEVTACMIEGARRLASDFDYAVELASENLPEVDRAVIEETVQTYQEREIWPTDGIITEERAQETMDFFFSVGEIDIDPSTIDLGDFFAFDVLDDARAQVGNG